MQFSKTQKKRDTQDDESLLAEYRSGGSLDSLSEIYMRYTGLVFGVCLKYLSDREMAKDAVMGIFEEIIVKAKNPDIKNFRPWLYVLSRNYCLMQLRREKKISVEPLSDFMEFEEDLHPEKMELESNLKNLELCKQKLVVEQRLSIELFFERKLCYLEISENTGFSLKEVKSYIQNGKRNLKICIETLQKGE